MAVHIYYKGPRGGPKSLTFFEDVKSRLDGLSLGSLDLNEDFLNKLTKEATGTYMDGTFVVKVKGSMIESYVAEEIKKKMGTRRSFYSDPKGNIKLLSDVLKSKDFQAKISEFYTKEHRRLTRVSLMSGYGNRNRGGK